MLAYHGSPRWDHQLGALAGLILFRKHLKRYLKNLPPTDAICSEMVVAKTTAEFESMLAYLDAKIGKYPVHVLSQIKSPEAMEKVSILM